MEIFSVTSALRPCDLKGNKILGKLKLHCDKTFCLYPSQNYKIRVPFKAKFFFLSIS